MSLKKIGINDVSHDKKKILINIYQFLDVLNLDLIVDVNHSYQFNLYKVCVNLNHQALVHLSICIYLVNFQFIPHLMYPEAEEVCVNNQV